MDSSELSRVLICMYLENRPLSDLQKFVLYDSALSINLELKDAVLQVDRFSIVLSNYIDHAVTNGEFKQWL